VVALVAGGIVWWRPWHSRAASTAQARLAASAPLPEPAPAVADDGAGTAAEPVEAGATANEAASADTAEAASREATAASPTPAGSVELTPGVGRAQLRLSFSADSRVAVYDYTGKPVFTGNGRANSVKTLSGMAPFRVYLGYASGVQLQVNDRAVAIGPQFVSGDVAHFEAGADGVLRRDPRPMSAGTPVPPAPTRAAPRG
jgi:cytoskeleton protein RodZ